MLDSSIIWSLWWLAKYHIHHFMVLAGFKRPACLVVTGMIGCGKTTVQRKIKGLPGVCSAPESSDPAEFWRVLTELPSGCKEREDLLFRTCSDKCRNMMSLERVPSLTVFDRFAMDSVYFATLGNYWSEENYAEAMELEGTNLRAKCDVKIFIIDFARPEDHMEILKARLARSFSDDREAKVRASEVGNYDWQSHLECSFAIRHFMLCMGYNSSHITHLVKQSNSAEEHSRIFRTILTKAIQ